MILRNKKSAGKLRTVNFDAYGNAIPNVPSVQKKGSNIAATIVETRKVAIAPRKNAKRKNVNNKTKRKAKSKSVETANNSLINRLLPSLPWTTPLLAKSKRTKPKSKNLPAKLKNSHTQLTKAQYIPKQEIQPHAHNISEFIELSFKRLNNEFNRREQQLEQRFLSLELHNKRAVASKRRWLIPAVIVASVVGSIAGGYMLYVLTSMQDSMTLMASNIPAMNQHMGAMANDTQAMSGNMQNMNQQMSSISQSIEPMGKAAATAQPFMGMMRSFFPF